MNTTTPTITIIADDEQAKHILLNAGVLQYLDPSLATGSSNVIGFRQICHKGSGMHLAAYHFHGRADGDNGYVVILADATVIPAADFKQFLQTYEDAQGGQSTRRIDDADFDAYVTSRTARQ